MLISALLERFLKTETIVANSPVDVMDVCAKFFMFQFVYGKIYKP